MCSFVGCRERKVWTWTVLCRRTRQVVACVVGDRGEETCRKLWEAIPEDYRGSYSYSDLWSVYCLVFPADKHQSVEKRTGQLAHIERWHNTVRQRLACYVRKSLSFSKSLYWHELVTRWFVVTYNLELASSVTILTLPEPQGAEDILVTEDDDSKRTVKPSGYWDRSAPPITGLPPPAHQTGVLPVPLLG